MPRRARAKRRKLAASPPSLGAKIVTEDIAGASSDNCGICWYSGCTSKQFRSPPEYYPNGSFKALILKDLYVSEHTLVEFHLTPINPSNLLWRLLVNIVCNIKNSDNGELLMSRILSLKQFSVLYVEIKHLQFIPHDNNIPTSHTANSEDLCIMCFDAPPNSILPCAHSFCRNCINTWVKSELRLPSSSRVSASNCASEVEWSNRQQCPICRDPCPRSSDAWDVLSEADTRTCKAEMAITVLNLIKNAGSPYKLPQPRQPASPAPTPSVHHP
ncbi:hypothetical protein SprV_0200655900 [Sparganum proliferum]